jgi:hypothetical protein
MINQTSAAAADPIFKKIDRYRAANSRLMNLREPIQADGSYIGGGQEYKKWQKANDRLCELLQVEENKVVATRPRTRAGAAEMVKAYLEVSSDVSGDHEAITLLENLLAYLKSDA